MENSAAVSGETVSTSSSSVPSSNPRPAGYRVIAYGIRPMELTKTEFFARIGAAVLSIVAFSVLAADSQTGSVRMTFSYFKSLNYLLAVDFLVLLYSAVQSVLLGFSLMKSFSYEPPTAAVLITFICDQVLTLLSFSASSSGATVCELARNGVANAWTPICTTLHVVSFCTQAEAAVSLSFLACLCLIASALFSGYRLAWQL